METAKKSITTAVDRMLIIRQAAKDAAAAAAKEKAKAAAEASK